MPQELRGPREIPSQFGVRSPVIGSRFEGRVRLTQGLNALTCAIDGIRPVLAFTRWNGGTAPTANACRHQFEVVTMFALIEEGIACVTQMKIVRDTAQTFGMSQK